MTRRQMTWRQMLPMDFPEPAKIFQDRYPADIWVLIFRYLYPSQLSRVSMTCKTFNSIVSSLEVWSDMFTKAYGHSARLRPLACFPKSKSFMIFMCCSSLHICESCFKLSDYTNATGSLYKLPLPIPVLLPRKSTNTVTYLGEKYDTSWTVRSCLFCRKDRLLTHEEPYPRNLSKNMRLDTLYVRYPGSSQVPELEFSTTRNRGTSVDERYAISKMRQHFGGSCGIQCALATTDALDATTEERIRWYQRQQ